jgi:hypothetical protein
MEKDINWECPKCHKPFEAENQKHHCIPESIHFHLGKSPPAIQKVFFALTEKIKSFGFFEVGSANSSVQFKLNSVFLTTRFKSDSLELEFQSEKPEIMIPPVHTVKIASNRYVHKIEVNDADELNKNLLSMLYTSYLIS